MAAAPPSKAVGGRFQHQPVPSGNPQRLEWRVSRQRTEVTRNHAILSRLSTRAGCPLRWPRPACANCGAAVRPLAQAHPWTTKRALRSPKIGAPGRGTLRSIDRYYRGARTIVDGPRWRSRPRIRLELSRGKHPLVPPACVGRHSTATARPKPAAPQRKSPTVTERTDMTVEFVPALLGAISRPGAPLTHSKSDATLDLSSLPPEKKWRKPRVTMARNI